jgi:molecular chaperone IbpA
MFQEPQPYRSLPEKYKWNNDHDQLSRHQPKKAPTPVTIYSLFPNIDRWALGFDPVFDTLKELAAQKSPSFPPYNITKEDDKYEITMALAGYKREQLSIEVKDRVLTVKTIEDMESDDNREVVHQGIAQRNFTSTFALADHVEVKEAKLEDGLLIIKLELELPEEKKPKQIEIS